MIDTDDFRKRASQLFEDCRTRWRKQLQKSAPKRVKIVIAPENVLPFSRDQFYSWLWKQTGLQAVPCPYCRTPIDILSLSLDHKTPLRRGGGPELGNLQVICKRCNGVKSSFTAEEFQLLVNFMDGPAAHFRRRLEGALINGGHASMIKFFPRQKKVDNQSKHTQDSLEFTEF